MCVGGGREGLIRDPVGGRVGLRTRRMGTGGNFKSNSLRLVPSLQCLSTVDNVKKATKLIVCHYIHFLLPVAGIQALSDEYFLP